MYGKGQKKTKEGVTNDLYKKKITHVSKKEN